jgi:rod shape-determining protein MreB
LKIKLASAWVTEELYAEVRGRDLISGLPKTIVTSTSEIREAIAEPLSDIVDAVKMTLEVTPPELAADIMEKGIMLAGGGALLNGMPECVAHETGMPVCVSPDPLHAVVLGSGQSLESFDSLKGVLFSSSQV